jgi:hypothetical protein
MMAGKVYIDEGVTEIVDAEDNTLLSVELTPETLILLDRDGSTVMRIARAALKWLDHGQRGELPQAEEKEVPPPTQGFFSA